MKAQVNKPTVVHTDSTFYFPSTYQSFWKYPFSNFLPAAQMGLSKTSSCLSLKTNDYLPSLFCKMEYKIESKSKLAPRFRLGSLNYTEWMEGKRELYTRYSP
ncbi:MAG: hypothetical protein ABJC12_01865 [Saprospiraceae bacterium]